MIINTLIIIFWLLVIKEQKAKLQKYLKKIDCILDILEMEKMDYSPCNARAAGSRDPLCQR